MSQEEDTLLDYGEDIDGVMEGVDEENEVKEDQSILMRVAGKFFY